MKQDFIKLCFVFKSGHISQDLEVYCGCLMQCYLMAYNRIYEMENSLMKVFPYLFSKSSS